MVSEMLSDLSYSMNKHASSYTCDVAKNAGEDPKKPGLGKRQSTFLFETAKYDHYAS
jgi:hypothetical protein